MLALLGFGFARRSSPRRLGALDLHPLLKEKPKKVTKPADNLTSDAYALDASIPALMAELCHSGLFQESLRSPLRRLDLGKRGGMPEVGGAVHVGGRQSVPVGRKGGADEIEPLRRQRNELAERRHIPELQGLLGAAARHRQAPTVCGKCRPSSTISLVMRFGK